MTGKTTAYLSCGRYYKQLFFLKNNDNGKKLQKPLKQFKPQVFYTYYIQFDSSYSQQALKSLIFHVKCCDLQQKAACI